MDNLLLKNVILSADASYNGKKAAAESRQVDLRVTNGSIKEIGSGLKSIENEPEYDCAGAALFPGFIDMHTHLRDFGESGAEDIKSGTQAAAAGGYTTVLTMANTVPPIDSLFVLRSYIDRIGTSSVVRVIPTAAVTKQLAGLELTNMVELAEAGAGAFSDDGKPISNLALLRRALDYAKLTEKVIISHAEDRDLSCDGSMNESARSTWLGLSGIPTASEAACVAREIEIVRYTKGRLHFAHVSTKASVELIRRAKQDGLPISADVTPHHLMLTDEDIASYDARLKMNPPLRSHEDQAALIAGLKDRTINAIATDHAPHSLSSKSKTFDQCPCGVTGLETAFSLLFERLVKGGHFTLSELIAFLTIEPAKILGIAASKIAVGEKADFTAIDLNQEWKYTTRNGFSKGQNSPFDGKTLMGKVVVTVSGGKAAYLAKSVSQSVPSGVG
jgi:dihydroorotase